MGYKEKLHVVLFLLLLAFIFSLEYKIHLDYKYPFHIDEWNHIAKAVQTTKNERIVFTDPYFKEQVPKVTHEEGFHVLLSTMFNISGLNIILHYRFLPALSAVFTALSLYVLVRRITSKTIALTSLFFLASIKSNVNLLGFWFYTPFSATFPLLYLTALSVVNALIKSKTNWLISAVILIAGLLIIYPTSMLFILTVSLLYLAFDPKRTLNLAKKIFSEKIFFIILTIVALSLIMIMFSQSASTSKFLSVLLERIVFPRKLIPYDVTYSLLSFYGLSASVVAFLAIILTLKDARVRFFIFWIFLSYSVIFMYHKKDYTVILPYARALYYGMLGMAPLSALGVFLIVGFVCRATKLVYPIILIGFVVMLSVMLFEPFQDFYSPPADIRLYEPINDADYDALVWLGGEYGGDHVVLASKWKSVAVYPINQDFVIDTIPAVIGGDHENASDSFFKEDCETKENILKEHRVEFVLADKVLDCNFLKNVFERSGAFIYKVD